MKTVTPKKSASNDVPPSAQFKCESCEAEFESNEDGVPQYECGECCTTFTPEESADGGSNRCPDCNKWAAKISDNCCPECWEGELVPITPPVPNTLPVPAPKPIPPVPPMEPIKATGAITINESKRLIDLEKIIEAGRKTFVEVGLALTEIRDKRLYRSDFKTFEDYCRAKWGWGKSYSYMLIDAAVVVKQLPAKVSTIVDTESKARELSKVAPAKRAKVLKVASKKGKVTAKAIKLAAKSVTPPVPPPPSNSKPKPKCDDTGLKIPHNLLELWETAYRKAKDLIALISAARVTIRDAQEAKDLVFAEVNFSSALAALDQAYADAKTAKPHAVCPTCQGELPQQCTACKGRGFVSEFYWNNCATKDQKEMREKVVAEQNNP